MVPSFFRNRFEEIEGGLRTYKPSFQELGDKIDFCIKPLRTLKSNKIFKNYVKELKTYIYKLTT